MLNIHKIWEFTLLLWRGYWLNSRGTLCYDCYVALLCVEDGIFLKCYPHSFLYRSCGSCVISIVCVLVYHQTLIRFNQSISCIPKWV
jgi:hypothetical protein